MKGEGLFYSIKDKALFWVAGYRSNTENVDDVCKMLQEGKKDFIEITEIDPSADIRTLEVTESQRYKHMRVFYVYDTDHIPEDAFVIGDSNKRNDNGPDHDWTMWRWLKG